LIPIRDEPEIEVESNTSNVEPPNNGRFVTVGPLVLFSTDTGDAWLSIPPTGWPLVWS
jgi:hypothetical protein